MALGATPTTGMSAVSANVPAGEHLEAASFFDHSYLGVDAVAFEWSRSGREGCETTDPRGIHLIPLSLTD